MYGAEICDDFASRLGVTRPDGMGVDYLISTMQNAWLTNTGKGNFIPTLMEDLRKVVAEKVAEIVHRHGLEPYKGKAR